MTHLILPFLRKNILIVLISAIHFCALISLTFSVGHQQSPPKKITLRTVQFEKERKPQVTTRKKTVSKKNKKIVAVQKKKTSPKKEIRKSVSKKLKAIESITKNLSKKNDEVAVVIKPLSLGSSQITPHSYQEDIICYIQTILSLPENTQTDIMLVISPRGEITSVKPLYKEADQLQYLQKILVGTCIPEWKHDIKEPLCIAITLKGT